MNGFQIRAAAVEDAGQIAEIRVTTWRETYRGLLPQAVLDGLDVVAETAKFTERIASLPPERHFAVAETGENRRVVGFCVCGPGRDPGDEDAGEIYALYVLPGFQGRGMGRALVRTGAEWLVSRGFLRMIIYVLRDNAPSRRFYEAIGGKAGLERTVEIGGLPAAEVGYFYDLGVDSRRGF